MILSDSPTTNDYFGYQRYADMLAKVILELQTEQTPFTIGIFGDWGSGKTSLMRMIEREIKYESGKILEQESVINDKSRIKTIWFNPWKYDNKEAIWAAFIQSILSEMTNDKTYLRKLKKRDRKKLLKKIQACTYQFAWYVAALGVKYLTNGLVDSKFVGKIKNVFTESDQLYNFVNKFEDEFGELTKIYAGELGKIAIFIDDLDRCIPENAITVLESIKLYLDKSKCVFIIGADRHIVEKGIHYRYKEEIDFSGKDYLEKIIQLPFVIPPIDDDSLSTSLRKEDEGLAELIDFNMGDKFEKLLIQGTSQNPRTLKRFLNYFGVIKGISSLNEPWELEILGRVLLIQMRFPEFFEYIASTENVMKRYDELLKCDDPKIEIKKPDYSDLEEYFCSNNELYRFMDKTREISCDNSMVLNSIIRLTKDIVLP